MQVDSVRALLVSGPVIGTEDVEKFFDKMLGLELHRLPRATTPKGQRGLQCAKFLYAKMLLFGSSALHCAKAMYAQGLCTYEEMPAQAQAIADFQNLTISGRSAWEKITGLHNSATQAKFFN